MCSCSWGSWWRRQGSVADLQSDDSFVVLCAAFAVNGSLHQTNSQSVAEAMWVYTHSGCSFACIFYRHIHLHFFVLVSDRRQNRWIGPTQSHSGEDNMQTPGVTVKYGCVNIFLFYCSLMPVSQMVLQSKYCGFEVYLGQLSLSIVHLLWYFHALSLYSQMYF